MNQVKIFNENADTYEAWYEKYPEVYLSEVAGFKDFEYNQTLFGELDEIKEVQLPKQSYGQGSFVVVKAVKK